MTDIDHLLASLGGLPLDPRLSAIDDAVLQGIEAARQPAFSRVGLGAVAALAMMAGALGTALPAGHRAGPAPLGVPGELAPSVLLADAR